MKLGILNGELGIAVIDNIDDLDYIQVVRLKNQMPEGAALNDVAFFYMADRDWIVINKSHALYEFYSETIPVYLELPEKSRKECIEAAPMETFKEGFAILDDIIWTRTLKNQQAVE